MAEPRYDPLMVPGCIPAPLRRALDSAGQNFTEIAGDITNIEGDVGDIIDILLTNPTNLADYFNHVDGDLSNYVQITPPLIPIELTTDMALGSGVYTASAKLLVWGGSSYSVTGTAATITDPYSSWWHAMTGDRGYLGYESISTRNVLIPLWLNTPYIRTGVLNTTDLAATTLATPANPQTVTVNSVDFSVYGVLVPTGKELVKSSTTYVSFYPDYVAKKYFAISTNVCATTP